MIRIVVPGPPPRKNRADRLTVDKRTGKPRRIKSKRAKDWRNDLYLAMGATLQLEVPECLPKRGRWAIRLDIYEEEMRHLDIDVPHGDVDSTVSAVMDALQPTKRLWGILDDDARVVEITARKHYDKSNPRVEIVLEEVMEQLPLSANESPWTESPAEAADRDRDQPKPLDIVDHVLAELTAACKILDPKCRGPRDTPGNRKLIARLHASERPTPEQWSTVIRRQLASVRSRPETHKFLSLSTLCVPRNFSRLLDAPGGRGTGGAAKPKAWAVSDFGDGDPEDT